MSNYVRANSRDVFVHAAAPLESLPPRSRGAVNFYLEARGEKAAPYVLGNKITPIEQGAELDRPIEGKVLDVVRGESRAVLVGTAMEHDVGMCGEDWVRGHRVDWLVLVFAEDERVRVCQARPVEVEACWVSAVA